jgi:hypothetical protein
MLSPATPESLCSAIGSMAKWQLQGHHALWTSFCSNALVTK